MNLNIIGYIVYLIISAVIITNVGPNMLQKWKCVYTKFTKKRLGTCITN